jgi:hypothetical protein
VDIYDLASDTFRHQAPSLLAVHDQLAAGARTWRDGWWIAALGPRDPVGDRLRAGAARASAATTT